jgi:pilus assembly protein CpaD
MSSLHLPDARRAPTWRGAAAMLRILAMAGCALSLGGCYTNQTVPSGLANDYRLRHPIAIKEGVRTVALLIGSKRGGLSPDQRADVLAFANAWRRDATGGILIDLPAGTRNELAAANAVHEVRSILSAAGVPPQAVEVRPYRTADAEKMGPLRLNYPTMTAEAGPCGLWPSDLGPTFNREHNENVPYYNFGCAIQRNFAAMVDNKADLVQPRGDVPAYMGRRTMVLDKYHRGENSATTYPDTDKAKISDVGK